MENKGWVRFGQGEPRPVHRVALAQVQLRPRSKKGQIVILVPRHCVSTKLPTCGQKFNGLLFGICLVIDLAVLSNCPSPTIVVKFVVLQTS